MHCVSRAVSITFLVGAVSCAEAGPPSSVPGLTGVWYSGHSDGMGVNWRSYLTFSDGRATSDIAGVMTHGRAWSETENPKKWWGFEAKGRDKLTLIRQNGSKYQRDFTVRTNPGKRNERLDGCWKAKRSFVASGYNVSGVAFSSRTICFEKDGRYSNVAKSAFGSVGGEGSGAGQSHRAEAGTYRVDGHVISFEAQDGSALRTSFGWYQSPKQPHRYLVIGKSQYEFQDE